MTYLWEQFVKENPTAKLNTFRVFDVDECNVLDSLGFEFDTDCIATILIWLNSEKHQREVLSIEKRSDGYDISSYITHDPESPSSNNKNVESVEEDVHFDDFNSAVKFLAGKIKK